MALYRERLEPALPHLLERLKAAAVRSGRTGTDVTLVAVTKSHPAGAVEAALQMGLTHLGENRIAELAWKREAFDGRGVHWHLIGHVQSRKSEGVLGLADLFHALDSAKLGSRLSRQLEEREGHLEVLLQVNTSGEESKGGFDCEQHVEEIHEMIELPRLQVRGLMTMAPFTANEGIVRNTFARLRELHERLRASTGYTGTELSMGMTSDFEVAIEEGSTLVRIGTALFGERE